MSNFFLNFKDDFLNHIRKSKFIFIGLIICFFIGLILGIFGVYSGVSFNSILNPSDKQMFDFIAGTSSGVSIFFDKLLEFFLIFLVIFIFNLSYPSSFLSYAFVGYQSFLLVLTCSVIINLYNFVGILNVIIFILPVNICFFLLLFFVISVAQIRAYEAKKYNLPFKESFRFAKFFNKYFLCFSIAIVICLIHSFIIPLLLKSFILFAY